MGVGGVDRLLDTYFREDGSSEVVQELLDGCMSMVVSTLRVAGTGMEAEGVDDGDGGEFGMGTVVTLTGDELR